jgi:rhodanese-related sulfurtransferase
MILLDAAIDEAPAQELAPLTLGAVLRAQRAGAQIIDTRSPAEFAGGHLADSIHIDLGGRFANWAEMLLSKTRPIAFICRPGSEREAAAELGRAGFHRVLGYLDGGIEAVRGYVALVRHPARITSGLLRRRMERGPVALIDVRGENEWRQEAIPGSVNIPLERFRERCAEIPPGPVVLYCRTGQRSSTAASLLEQTGRMNVLDLVGGITAWKAAA